ncbi:UNVERIFIED_ORG: ribosomal protein S18 acetylase RimI-like enzyme [Pseudomonas psychrophila]
MHTIRVMSLDDYDQVIELMKRTPGISLRDADSRAATARYLQRNPDMSFVAEVGGVLAGCVMCGHDGAEGICSICWCCRSIGVRALPMHWSSVA